MSQHLPRAARMAAVVLGLAGLAAPAWGQATRAEDWDKIFTRSEGWTGADGAGTVTLPDGRLLWMFGDTWIGRVEQGKHAAGSKLVSITLGIHPLPADPGTPPPAESVEFAWGQPNEAGQPTAWLTPDPEIAGSRKTWFWPMGGGAVVPRGDGAESLVIFMWSLSRTPEDRGVWSFQVTGNVLAVVDNWREPLPDWKARQIKLPHGRVPGPDQPLTIDWGYAALADEGSAADRYLYIYGLVNHQIHNRDLLVARVPIGRALDFSAWRFYAGDEKWSDRVEDARGIAQGLVSEFSVERIGTGAEQRYYLVQSEPHLGKHVLLRAARSMVGPFSQPQAVFEVPELAKNPAYMTYAAKGHAALSPPGELLITYVVNSTDFGAMVADAEIYRPRFIRVPLDTVTAP